jgi:hypothetical protein
MSTKKDKCAPTWHRDFKGLTLPDGSRYRSDTPIKLDKVSNYVANSRYIAEIRRRENEYWKGKPWWERQAASAFGAAHDMGWAGVGERQEPGSGKGAWDMDLAEMRKFSIPQEGNQPSGTIANEGGGVTRKRRHSTSKKAKRRQRTYRRD